MSQPSHVIPSSDTHKIILSPQRFVKCNLLPDERILTIPSCSVYFKLTADGFLSAYEPPYETRTDAIEATEGRRGV